MAATRVERQAGVSVLTLVKRLLRTPVVERIDGAESASIARFVEIWYSPATRAQLKRILIRD